VVPVTPVGNRLLLPLFGRADGWSSAVDVRNVGGSPAEVELRWLPHGGGAVWRDRVPVRPGTVVTLPRADGPALPAGQLGAAVLLAERGVLAALVHHGRDDAREAVAYPALTEGGTELAISLADLSGLPEQRLLAVQNAEPAPAPLTIRYLDAAGGELDRVRDVLPGGGARGYRPRPAGADAARVEVQSVAGPVVAALLQLP
jgi:hypothetical protein